MGDIEVEGSSNRVAGHDYNENVVNLHSIGHISQIGTQVNINNGAPPELLSPEQRRCLNRLVTEISGDYQVDPRTLWKRVVHTQTGVSSIDDIPREKFAVAEQALLDHAQQLHAQAHAARLADELELLARQYGLYQELARFCSREFGSTVLNKLNPEQLKTALRFVEERAQRNLQAPAATAPSVVTSWGAQMVELWVQQPSQMVALVVVSAIFGRFVLG